MRDEVKIEIQKRIERSGSFQRVFSGPDGDKVREELGKNFTGQFNPDPYIHAYNAGQRSVLTFIDNCIHADVEKAKKQLEKGQNNE